MKRNSLKQMTPVADPGFPRRVSANPKGRFQPIIWPFFPENCMKMKVIGRRGDVPGAPLDQPIDALYIKDLF